MKLIKRIALFFLGSIFLAGCSRWSSDSYWRGVADGAYSGCQYVLIKEIDAGKRKWNEADFEMCSDVWWEWTENNRRNK